jgi:putative ABC transport system permease protein
MIKNYLLISFRNLRKHFSYSLINILGLGLGLATCLLLFTWIRHELSYDKFNEKYDRIYRSSLEYSFGGQVARTSVSPTALLPTLMTLPETETGVRVYNASSWNAYIVKNGERIFQEKRFYAADSTFFKVFSYKLIKGNPKTALVEPNTVILTESMVRKYFGDEDALGKVLQVNGNKDYTVTGIIEDVPTNSLLQFDFLCSFSSLRVASQELQWWSANYQTFVVLQPNGDLSALRDKTNEIVKKAVANRTSGENDYVRYNFTPLTDIYLKSDFANEPEVVSDIKYVYIFSGIAALILIIACINYINLATARAADRAKEVGIRKVVGALRKQLFFQFISESVIITLFAFCLAYLLAQGMLPLFNSLTGKNFSYELLTEPSFVAISLGVLMVIAILSGAYPAFAITSFKPVSVLKGNFKSSSKGIWLRKSLVVFQFAISVVLITGTIIIVKQLDFIQGTNLGYDRENTIILPLDKQTAEVFDGLKTELTRNEVALHVGRGTESPVNIHGGYTIKANDNDQPGMVITGLLIDEEYLPAMDIQLLQGRNFTKEDRERVSKDTVYTFILNESALAALYIPKEEALGRKVFMGRRRGEIIGVAKDFHFASLHRNIGPLVIFPEEIQFNKLFIKIPAGDLSKNLEKIKNIYSSLITHRPFEFEFLDQQYAALYTNEQRLSSVFIVFATLAIIIACLGLFGLVSFSASQKTKEIGIRKVLGATASNIVLLITKDFTKLVVIAILMGIPVAYWIMYQWLGAFAYKTEMGIGPVVIASVICIAIALGTAGYQAVKAALIDPAKTLRNE